MDPIATIILLIQAACDDDWLTAKCALDDLIEWRSKGGFGVKFSQGLHVFSPEDVREVKTMQVWAYK